jgi:serine protease AprX
MRLHVPAVVCLAALVLNPVVGAARADNPHGPNVDDRVAFTADVSAPNAEIPVIVFSKSAGGRQNRSLAVKAQLFAQATAGSVKAAQLDQLAHDPNVAFIAPDVAVSPLAMRGNAPSGTAFPGLATLYPIVDNAPAAWAQGYTGAGQGIAVIDSGTTKDDFGQRLRDSVGANRGNDAYGHGMLVSHVAAGSSGDGSYVGIAPGANVISYNVDSGAGASTSDLIAALNWVMANQSKYNIKVVNISLAETSPSSASQSLLDSVIELAQQSYGILVVTSAGNSGPNSMLFAPANDPFALSVGATDTMGTAAPGDDGVAPWSSYGTTLDGYAKPEIVAPGRRIVSYLSPNTVLGAQAPAANWVARNYASISGTSFSAPQVAGAAAVLFQAHPTWTPGQVKWVLTRTARPVLGSTARSLDLGAALAYSGAPPDANAGLAPSAFGLSDGVSGLPQGNQGGWKHATSTQSSWTQSSWTQSSWTQSSWTQSSWTQSSWTANSW